MKIEVFFLKLLSSNFVTAEALTAVFFCVFSCLLAFVFAPKTLCLVGDLRLVFFDQHSILRFAVAKAKVTCIFFLRAKTKFFEKNCIFSSFSIATLGEIEYNSI